MNETISMKNLFRIESFMEACRSNYSYAALSNNIEYTASRTYSLNSILEHSKFIIGINDFCCFTTTNIRSFIVDKIQAGIKLILPAYLDLPLQLMPFCISSDDWSKNFIANYISSSYNNVSKYIADIGHNDMIYISKEWSSHDQNCIVSNCINYNIENIFSIIVNQNHKFGII